MDELEDELGVVKAVINEVATGQLQLPPPFAETGEEKAEESGIAFTPGKAPPLKEVLINIFPSNPFAAMSQGNMLQVIVFAVLFGIALTLSGSAGKRLLAGFQDLNKVVMQLVLILGEFLALILGAGIVGPSFRNRRHRKNRGRFINVK